MGLRVRRERRHTHPVDGHRRLPVRSTRVWLAGGRHRSAHGRPVANVSVSALRAPGPRTPTCRETTAGASDRRVPFHLSRRRIRLSGSTPWSGTCGSTPSVWMKVCSATGHDAGGACSSPAVQRVRLRPDRRDRSILGFGWSSDAPNSTAGSSVGPVDVTGRPGRSTSRRSAWRPVRPAVRRMADARVRHLDPGGLEHAWRLAVHWTTALVQGAHDPDAVGQRPRRSVKLTMRSNRGNPYYMDMLELSVPAGVMPS